MRKKMPKYRLLDDSIIDGARVEAGTIIERPAGWKGPYECVRKSHDRIDYDPINGLDANRILGEMADEPLYVLVEE
jgi:hypothetical protein